MVKIVLDSGHGLYTSGKRVPDGSMKEWQFNSRVVEIIIGLLKAYKDVQVLRVDDPTGKTDTPLAARTNQANDFRADAYYSIHANAYGSGGFNDARGIETFTYLNPTPQAKRLATLVNDSLVKATGLPNRGVKSANFAVLRDSKMTAILVECGFMTNKAEAELLKSEAYRQKCAKAIVQAMVTFHDLKEVKPVSTPKQEVSATHKNAWERAIKLGITNGDNPKNPITREQNATMLMRLLDYIEEKK